MRLVLCILILSHTAFALDPASQQALQQTQELLKTPDKRNNALKETPEATAAGNQVTSVAKDPQDQQKIYELSSKVMERLVRESQGDPEKMTQLLERAKTNPEDFANSLTSDERDSLRGVAGSIESKTVTAPH